MKKIISIVMAISMVFSLGISLIGCNVSEEKDAYSFTFDMNYEGGKDRVDTVQAGFRANYYSAKRSGYTLINWYLNEDCSGEPFDFSTPINQDYTVYAKWEVKGDEVQITFNYNFENCPNSVTITGEEGKPIGSENLPAYKRIGYDLTGWYTEPPCENAWDVENDRLTGDLELYAKYEYNADLKFDENDEVILENVEVDISVQMGAWDGRRALTEIVNKFNEEYVGKVHLNWVSPYTSEVMRFEDPGFTNQYTQNNYCMGDLLDLVHIEFDKSDYYEDAIQENFIGDSLMTYPVGHMVPSVMYNKSILASIGESAPQTHTDFVRVLKKATEANAENAEYLASLVYEGAEWQWAEMAANNIWTNNGLTYYSYDSVTKTHVNNFAQPENREKAANAIKGFVELFNNPAISLSGDADFWNGNGLENILSGKIFMGVVGYSRILSGQNSQFFDKIGLLPITNLFNFGNIENPKTFVKGVSVCLPNDTTAIYDIEQLAGVAVFCDFMSENSAVLAYNDAVPASKTSQNSEDYKNAQSKYFRIIKQLGDPSTFITLPGHMYEYYFYNYQSNAYAQMLMSVDYDSLNDDAMLDATIQYIADDISNIIR